MSFFQGLYLFHIERKGRLGRQLFQIAYLKAWAKKYKINKIGLNSKWKYQDNFNFDFFEILSPEKKLVYDFNFNPENWKSQDIGIFLCPKIDIENPYFTLSSSFGSKLVQQKKIIDQSITLNQKTRKFICTIHYSHKKHSDNSYYIKAMTLFDFLYGPENVIFYIFSTAEAKPEIFNYSKCIYHKLGNELEDLCLMNKWDGQIIDHSNFALGSILLRNSTSNVICPKEMNLFGMKLIYI